MSTRDRRAQQNKRTRSNSRRNTVLNVDLNAAPQGENGDQEVTSTHAVSGDTTNGQRGASLTPAAIDVEALDDDVIISSPRAFAAAKNNSRRNQGRVIVLDVDSEDPAPRGSSRDKRRRASTNQATTSGNVPIDLEGHNCQKRVDLKSAIPPPPKEPTFSCPVCMGPLVEEMSTKCGHIFCKACIKASVAAQGKCPTCRRKMTMKDTIRVYLPTTC
ncbi:putative glutaredoxin-C14-like [Capsicum annuum]|uniref:E3 ubiquitin-protein ligase RNF4 n=1 Tax=Capsicum annuum TaxID=4072 RepID=UPI0007BF90F3|nr:E3 ubiquitin-protein ligase RNF4 [Capsicum annuum]XP_047269403.1 E3 ubiquitin-protein ligase RNF4 [Capsicum annuum]KAF3682138.1 putative glutaredoxin-C14-like [Capsicum annuum]